MTEIMPHSENNLNLFYWTPPPRAPRYFLLVQKVTKKHTKGEKTTVFSPLYPSFL